MVNKIILLNNIFLSNFKRLNSPYRVNFALTYRCNLQCKICNIWKTPHRKELTIREIDKIFRGLKNISWVNLTGGEITLREDLSDIIKVIARNAKKLLFLHISTNGQLPHKVFLLTKEILKLGITPIINVSINVPERINDRLLVKNDSTYLNSIETFNSVKRLRRGHYYLCCTISSYNINYLEELLSGLKKDISSFSLSNMHFNIFHNSPHYYQNEDIEGFSGLQFDSVKKYLVGRRGNFIKRFLEARYARGLYNYLNGDKFPVECQALKSVCFISPFGEVFPCEFYGKAVGFLKDYNYNLKKLWNSFNAFQIRQAIENKNCPSCWSPCQAYAALLGNMKKTLFI